MPCEDRLLRPNGTGRRQVNRFQNDGRDDDNDTRLFEALEAYILLHYPNPERVGCLEHDLLTCLVETPEQLDLSDPTYLHIFRCAECTRELREIRSARKARSQRDAVTSPPLSDAQIKAARKWRQRIVAFAFKAHLMVVRAIEKLKSVFR